MDKIAQTQVDNFATKVALNALNNLISDCLDSDGKPKAPSKEVILNGRKLLSERFSNTLIPKQTIPDVIKRRFEPKYCYYHPETNLLVGEIKRLDLEKDVLDKNRLYQWFVVRDGKLEPLGMLGLVEAGPSTIRSFVSGLLVTSNVVGYLSIFQYKTTYPLVEIDERNLLSDEYASLINEYLDKLDQA